jgi:hypothetical protein
MDKALTETIIGVIKHRMLTPSAANKSKVYLPIGVETPRRFTSMSDVRRGLTTVGYRDAAQFQGSEHPLPAISRDRKS